MKEYIPQNWHQFWRTCTQATGTPCYLSGWWWSNCNR